MDLDLEHRLLAAVTARPPLGQLGLERVFMTMSTMDTRTGG